MPLGAHLPTSKGFLAALEQAQELDCDCLQIFSKSPRQWKAAPLDPEMAAAFRAARQKAGCLPLVVHDSYLINLAAPDEEKRQKSIAAMIDEVERAELLGCDYLVTHCGAHLQKDCGAQGEEQGLQNLAASLRAVLEATPTAKVKIALANTAAQGTCLGGPFEHLGGVLHAVGSERLAVCFDTCHAFAAGHDVASEAGLESALQNFDEAIGLEHLAVVHLNDSKGELGRNLDRHEHIGQGLIGEDGMRRILHDPRLQEKPFILETPDTENMIEVNLAMVRSLREGTLRPAAAPALQS
jgi:deoxyribonuclease-4